MTKNDEILERLVRVEEKVTTINEAITEIKGIIAPSTISGQQSETNRRLTAIEKAIADSAGQSKANIRNLQLISVILGIITAGLVIAHALGW